MVEIIVFYVVIIVEKLNYLPDVVLTITVICQII